MSAIWRGGDPADDLTGATRIKLDRDVGEKSDRESGGHLDRARGLEQTGHPCSQHRTEGALADRCHHADRQQLAGCRQPPEQLAVGVEQNVGDLLTERGEIVGRKLKEIFELGRIAPEQTRQLQHLGARAQRRAHPSTRRTGARSSLGTWPRALSPAAVNSAA